MCIRDSHKGADGRQGHDQHHGGADEAGRDRRVADDQGPDDADGVPHRFGQPQPRLSHDFKDDVDDEGLHHQRERRSLLRLDDLDQQLLVQQLRVVGHHRHIAAGEEETDCKGQEL